MGATKMRAASAPRRRTVVALAVVAVIIVAFVVRLVDIQVVRANDHLADASEKGLHGSRALFGVRGSIVDSDGDTLAASTELYDANIDPYLATNMTDRVDGDEVDVPFGEFAPDIARVLDMDAEDVEKIVEGAVAEDPGDRWARLAQDITTTQYVDLVDLGLPFLSFEAKPARSYPNGQVAGNLLGYMSSDGDALAGYERMADSCLASSNGEEDYQQSPSGIRIPGTETSTPATDGGTLQLTIDSDLQWYLQELIAEEAADKKAEWGSITVVDAKTGAIRAAAESPSVDPNDPVATAPEDRGSRLFRTTFEPGSTFKAVTAAMLIDQGKADPLSTEWVPSREEFPNGAIVNDATDHAAANYTLAGVLDESLNVGISKFSDRLSMQTRHDYLEKVGVGTETAIGFAGEESGVLHPADTWDAQTRYTTAFGQAFTVTAPQVANVYQAFANDGVKMPLHIVESCTTADGEVEEPELPEPERIVKGSTADTMLNLIENVALAGSNTVDVPGYRVGIKTGTAQKSDGQGGYKPGVYATSIVGVAPIDDPQYVVVVTLDEPKTIRSSAATVPALTDALTQVMKNYRVEPSSGNPTIYPKTR